MQPWTERVDGAIRPLDARRLPSPCFVVDEVAVEENLRILNARSASRAARRCCSRSRPSRCGASGRWSAKYLSGTCASGVHEARLGREHFGGEVHTYSAAYTEADLKRGPEDFRSRGVQLACAVEAVPFDLRVVSRQEIRSAGQPRALRRRSRALRPLRAVLAPRHAARRDPAGRSRRPERPALPHALRAGPAAAGAHARRSSRRSSATCSKGMKWVNFGGGHHITRPGYQVEALISLVKEFSRRCERAGLPRAGRGDRLPRGRAGRRSARRDAQRHADRDPRHLRHLPHAGHAGDALPRADHRRGRARRAAAHLPPGRPVLPRRRRHRRLFVRAAARRSASAWCSRTWPTTPW